MTTGAMHILDNTGDTKKIWDSTKPDEVEAARKTFDFLVTEKKYLAYKVDNNGDKGQLMRSFDPKAEKMILQPQNVGG